MAAYFAAIAMGLAVWAVIDRSAVTAAYGAAAALVASLTWFGRGDGTSWLRGDLDERRSHAVDHAFRTGFFVATWWIAGVAIYASDHRVGPALLGAGNAAAIGAAWVDYALVLRRT